MEIIGQIYVDDSSYATSDPSVETEQSFPFQERDFEDLDAKEEILVRITELYEPPSIYVDFVFEQEEERVEIDPEDISESHWSEERLAALARELELPQFVQDLEASENRVFDVKVVDDFTDTETLHFFLGYKSIYAEILNKFKEISLHDHAGPWIGGNITWNFEVIITERK